MVAIRDPRSAYGADRAAALAGVPKSTLHYWARTGLLVPSVSAERIKLWSYEDLMAIRVIDWLRTEKHDASGERFARTPSPEIRRALEKLRSLDRGIWGEDGPSLRVDRSGRIYLDQNGKHATVGGQLPLDDVLDLFAPFEIHAGITGPDLRRPRPHLRIIQGKLAGAPHVASTRVETASIVALADRGFETEEIVEMYPFLERRHVEEAVELERQLAQNLLAA